MKKIIYLSLLSAAILAENKIWLSIADLGIDNSGKPVTNAEIKSIEAVDVCFRLADIAENIEKGIKNAYSDIRR